MKIIQVSSLILLGSPVSSTSRFLQGENDTAINTAIATDGGIVLNATTAPTEPAGDAVAPTEYTAENVTNSLDYTAEASDDTTEGSSAATLASSTLVFSDGDQHTLDPNEISDNNNNVQVRGSSTLFITNNFISLYGYCSDCPFPNATIDVTGVSNLIVRGEDISIFGSNQSSIINGAGGSAIELTFTSRAMIDGSILIRGGDGNKENGGSSVGGDALGVYNESFVEIDGDVTLQGGDGVKPGKAMAVSTGSVVKIRSGIFKSEVWVESTGVIDVYGGTFEEAVAVNGDEAFATFEGCFSISERDLGGVNYVELSGVFFNDTEIKTINVTLFDGATVKTVGDNECANTTTTSTTGNNTNSSASDDDDVSGYGGNATYDGDAGNSTYAPTFMPTGLSESDESKNECEEKATSNVLLMTISFVIAQLVSNLF